MDMTRVLIVDDQELVRTGFHLILDSEDGIEVVGEAADGQAALDWLSVNTCDVVLMDVRMPRLDGVEATARITSTPDSPRVIILTTFDLDEYVFAALRNGASGFLLKDTPIEELINAIRVVAAGDALLSPSVTKTLIEEFQGVPGESLAANGSVPENLDDGDDRPGNNNPGPVGTGMSALTEREREVLIEMAKGLSNAEIGEALFVGEATVKTHVGRILTKLEVRDRVQAVVVAYESGMVTPGD